MSVLRELCCQVEVSVSGRSLVQRSLIECDVSECNCEASIMRRPWSTRGCCAVGELGLLSIVRLFFLLNKSINCEIIQLCL
jgi:hypothetical protein